MRRHWLLALAVLLGLFAGVLVYRNIQLAPVVVAARPLALGDLLVPDALTLRDVNPASLPEGAVTSLGAAVGAFATGPIPTGQYIVAGQLAGSRRAALLAHAGPIPPGHALVAIPIDATRALGGVVPPSQVVDVLVVGPDPTAVQTLPATAPPIVEILGRGVLLVELRTDRGEPLLAPSGDGGLDRGPKGRIGAAVLAVPSADVPRYVVRIPSGTFVLSQRLDEPASASIDSGRQISADTK